MDKNTVKKHIAEAQARLENVPRYQREPYQVDLAMIEVLGEMALLDMCPDGTFSDAECNAWEAIGRVIRKAKEMA